MEQIPFPNKKYQIIYADPPWQYNDKMAPNSWRIDKSIKQLVRAVRTKHSKKPDIVRENAVSRICRLIAERDRCVPFSPIHAFSFYHALDAEATERVMRMCMELLETCDEMWVFGDMKGAAS